MIETLTDAATCNSTLAWPHPFLIQGIMACSNALTCEMESSHARPM